MGKPVALLVPTDFIHPSTEGIAVLFAYRESIQRPDKFLHAGELQRRAEEYRKQLSLFNRRNYAFLSERALFKILFHQHFICSGDFFCVILVKNTPQAAAVGTDFAAIFPAIALAAPSLTIGMILAVADPSGTPDFSISISTAATPQPAEVGKNAASKLLGKLLEHFFPACPGKIRLIHKHKGGHLIMPKQLPKGQSMGLHPVRCAHHKDSTVHHLKCSFRFTAKIAVPRGVQKRKLLFPHCKPRFLREYRYTPLTLDFVRVQKRVPMVNPPHLAYRPRKVQNPLRQGSFPCIHMSQYSHCDVFRPHKNSFLIFTSASYFPASPPAYHSA